MSKNMKKVSKRIRKSALRNIGRTPEEREQDRMDVVLVISKLSAEVDNDLEEIIRKQEREIAAWKRANPKTPMGTSATGKAMLERHKQRRNRHHSLVGNELEP